MSIASLTETHRLRQVQLSLRAAQQSNTVWSTLDPSAIERTTQAWLSLMLQMIERYRTESADLAADYYRSVRALELGRTASVPRAALPALNTTQITKSLLVTGPATIRRLELLGAPPERAAARALVKTAGAVTRHVLNGGRDEITETTRRDEDAIGFIRVTKPDPCYFCALLASRGPTYKTRASAGPNRKSSRNAEDPNGTFEGPGEYKVHDNCRCSVEPVFHADQPWPGKAQEWAQLYASSTKNSTDKLNAFRRAYEGRKNPFAAA